MVLNSMPRLTFHELKLDKPVVTCGIVGYNPCLPYANGRKPKPCDIHENRKRKRRKVKNFCIWSSAAAVLECGTLLNTRSRMA
ncbi:hypothetical protein MLD38_034722 [Melastoma candidum]|uniref:Uncharacterized protein n=1 Tax=Melastoma candidum TaxID=119954 RepID=A0ACB9MAY6_9MYRT|nr:hypothetical protein MLD38_034722 [Melastoma candidum]